jgi:hypothetical protein
MRTDGGKAEEQGGKTEKHGGEAEKHGGEAEKHGGEAEKHGGEAEKHGGEAEKHGGEAEKHGGEAEEGFFVLVSLSRCLVTKLQLGNGVLEAPASKWASDGAIAQRKLELPPLHCQARAWQRV